MRGIVTDIKNNYCIVLKNDGTFINLHNRNYVVGQEITVRQSGYIRYAAVAACVLIACFSGIGLNLYYTPSSYVYLDINPSIRLDINSFDKVIKIVPLNSDAEELLKNSDISCGDTQNCINKIIQSCWEQKYINEDNTDIEVSILTNNEKIETDVDEAKLEMEQEDLEVFVFRMNEDENNEAMERKVSAKRLRAVRAYTEHFGGTLDENMEKLKGLSSDELYSKIEADRALKEQYKNTDEEQKSEENNKNTKSYIKKTTDEHDKEINNSVISSNGEAVQPEKTDGLPEKRRKAIRAYTAAFGGTFEENALTLQGVDTEEIYEKISSAKDD